MLSLALTFVVTLQNAGAPVQEVPVTAEARDEAIRKGFEFLDKNVWDLNEHGSPQKQYTIAITAWASLLAAYHEGDAKKLPSRAKELDQLRKYLERYVGDVAHDYEKDDAKAQKGKAHGQDPKQPEEPGDLSAAFTRRAQYVWPVGMAAHYFAESFARGREKADSKAALKDAVVVLEAAQQPNGGWGHDDAARPGMGLPPIKIPKPGGGDDLIYPATLLAASNCALSGLGVAHAKLGTKSPESLKKGIQYYLGAQNEDGTFPYDPTQKHEGMGAMGAEGKGPATGKGASHGGSMMGGLEVARTPAAYFALACAGMPLTSKEARAALRAMDEHPDCWSEGHGSATMALQFAALAARQRGDAAWATFRRLYFPRILAHQEESGAFTCVAEAKEPGVTSDTEPIPGLSGMSDWTEQQKVYVTSIHVLVLLLDRSKPAALPPMAAAPTATTTSAK